MKQDNLLYIENEKVYHLKLLLKVKQDLVRSEKRYKKINKSSSIGKSRMHLKDLIYLIKNFKEEIINKKEFIDRIKRRIGT